MYKTYIRVVFGSALIVPRRKGGKFGDPFISFLKVMFIVSPSVTMYDTLVNPCTVEKQISKSEHTQSTIVHLRSSCHFKFHNNLNCA